VCRPQKLFSIERAVVQLAAGEPAGVSEGGPKFVAASAVVKRAAVNIAAAGRWSPGSGRRVETGLRSRRGRVIEALSPARKGRIHRIEARTLARKGLRCAPTGVGLRVSRSRPAAKSWISRGIAAIIPVWIPATATKEIYHIINSICLY